MSFEQSILANLAQRGLIVDAGGRLVRLPGYSGPQHVSDEQIRVFNERQAAPSLNTDLEFDWINGLADAVRVLTSEGTNAPWPWSSVFWTRLLGIFVDLQSRYRETFAVAGIDPATHAATPTSVLEWTIETYRAIEALRGVFTEDELIYIDYRRHAEGHPKQHAYAISLNNRGQIREGRRLEILGGRELPISDVQDTIRRVESAHGSIHAAAVAFAGRIAAPLANLHRLARKGHGR